MKFCNDFEFDINAYELKNKPEGNLLDFIKLGNDLLYERYEVTKEDNIEKIVDGVLNDCKIYLKEDAECKDYEVIDDVIKNGYSKSYTENLLIVGVLYSYKNKYYIPDDIIKYYNKSVKINMRYNNCFKDAYIDLMSKIVLFGYAKAEDVLLLNCEYLISLNSKEWNKIDREFNIIEIDEEPYYVFSNCSKEEMQGIIDVGKYNIDIDERIEYYDRMSTVVGEVLNCFAPRIKFNYISYSNIIKCISKRQRSSSDIARSICELFDNYDNQKEIEKIINKVYEYIKYWSYGGLTDIEYRVENYYIFPKKVKGKSIEVWLKHMNKDAIRDLYERFNVSSIEDLSSSIINKAKEDFEKGKCFWEEEFINDFQDGICEAEMFDSLEILNCKVFLYEDDYKKAHVYFPKEIVDLAKEQPSLEDMFDNIKGMIKEIVVSRELYMQGIVERDTFVDKLINSGIFKSTEDVDNVVLGLNGSIKDNLYVTNYNLSDIEIGSIYAIKRQCKFYKNNDVLAFGPGVEIEKNKEHAMQDELIKVLDGKIKSDKEISQVIGTLLYMLHINSYDEGVLDQMIKELNIKDKNLIKDIKDIVDKYKDDMPVWTYNGYSVREMKFLTAEDNDPCPCGSGKKFKKCCGKKVQNS